MLVLENNLICINKSSVFGAGSLVLNWNKDTVDDAVIFKHLLDLSDGEIDLTNSDETLSESKNLLRKRSSQQGNKGKTHSSTNRNTSNRSNYTNRKR